MRRQLDARDPEGNRGYVDPPSGEDVTRVDPRIEALENEVLKLREDADSREASFRQLQKDYEGQAALLKESQETICDQREAISDLDQQCLVLESDLKHLEEKYSQTTAELTEEISGGRKEDANRESTIRELEAVREASTQSLKIREAAIESMESEIAALRDHLEAEVREQTTLREHTRDVEVSETEMRAKVDALNLRVENEKAALISKVSEIDRQAEEINDLRARCDTAEKEAEYWKDAATQREFDFGSLSRQVNGEDFLRRLSVKLSSLKGSSLDEDKENLVLRLDSLLEERKCMAAIIEELQVELKDRNDKVKSLEDDIQLKMIASEREIASLEERHSQEVQQLEEKVALVESQIANQDADVKSSSSHEYDDSEVASDIDSSFALAVDTIHDLILEKQRSFEHNRDMVQDVIDTLRNTDSWDQKEKEIEDIHESLNGILASQEEMISRMEKERYELERRKVSFLFLSGVSPCSSRDLTLMLLLGNF